MSYATQKHTHPRAYRKRANPKVLPHLRGQLHSLDDVIDPMTLLEAIAFLDDYAVAMAAFEAELERTGTP